jgi:hypothetical protein
VESRCRATLAELTLLCVSSDLFAQDTEPRRWAQMPAGLNFIGVGTRYTQGDIFLDPVLLAEDLVWASLSTAFGSGLQATINGLPKDNKASKWGTAVSVGLPLSRTQGLKELGGWSCFEMVLR